MPLSGQQITSELSTVLQWISRLQTEVVGIAADTSALRVSAHNHSLTLVQLTTELSTVVALVHGLSAPNLAPVLTAIATLSQKVDHMSQTLSEQLDAATAAIQADVAAVSAEVTALLASVTPGSMITQAQVDALTAIDASLKAIPPATPSTP